MRVQVTEFNNITIYQPGDCNRNFSAGGRGVASSNLVIPTETENADNQGNLPDNQCFLFYLIAH